ncbi:hypothetical protein K7432_000549 [Basidiobolus ranarum]|uniref:BHLH domain-containing protein n=1 Tax=Basidiobolus ranarum TaxID=34480 RepID=A0ABR2X4G8_9FUNG
METKPYNKGGCISMVVPTQGCSQNGPSGSSPRPIPDSRPYPLTNPTVGTKLKLFRFENSMQGKARKPRKSRKTDSYLLNGVNILNNDNSEYKANLRKTKPRDPCKPKPNDLVDPAVKKLVDMIPSSGGGESNHDTTHVLKRAAEYLERLQNENQNLRFENQLLKEQPPVNSDASKHPSIVITGSENSEHVNGYTSFSARSSQVTSPCASPIPRPLEPGSPLFVQDCRYLDYDYNHVTQARSAPNSPYHSNSSTASSPSQTPPPQNLAPIRSDLPLLPPLTSFLQADTKTPRTRSLSSSPIMVHTSRHQAPPPKNFIDNAPIQFAFSLSNSPKHQTNQSTFFNAYAM